MSAPLAWLLRHGQTAFNLAGRYQGRVDSPLTALGQAQAEGFGRLLAAHLPAGVEIRTSPLPRARRTAEAIAAALPGARLVEDARLLELSMGAWDGLTRAEIAAGWPDARRGHAKRMWMFHAPGGERLADLAGRCAALLDELAARAAPPPVLVSHAITGRVLRGLHLRLPLEAALQMEARQDLVHRLEPDGRISDLPSTGL